MSDNELQHSPYTGHDDSKDTVTTDNTPTVVVAEPLPSPRSNIRLYIILAAEYLSLFIAALDQTITATALPTISAQLHSGSGYTWIGGAYLLANASFAPIWASLSNIWGRKPVHLVATAVFAIGSIICATAPTMQVLIAGRAIQGSAGGALMQLTTITISDLFSMRQRSLVLGFLEFVWALAGGIGPVLGGTFTEKVTWRWNFWVNLPICGLTFGLLAIFLDVHNPRTNAKDGLKAIDWVGSLTILGFVLMLLIGLDMGGTFYPWSSPRVIALIVAGCVLAGMFILTERKLARYPLIPKRIFSAPSNIASLVVVGCHGFVSYSFGPLTVLVLIYIPPGLHSW